MKKVLLIVFCVLFGGKYFGQHPFVTIWNTTNETIGSNTYNVIKLSSTGQAEVTYENTDDATITGSRTLYNVGYQTIIVPRSGRYKLSIFPGSQFHMWMNNSRLTAEDAGNLLEVTQWGDNIWFEDVSNFFVGAVNLKISATDIPNFSKVTNMESMFQGCRSLTTIPNIDKWNTSTVQNFNSMFYNAANFNGNIGLWDVSKARSLNYMLFGASLFNQDLSKWVFWPDASPGYAIGNSGLSCENYTKTLAGWSKLPFKTSQGYLFATNLVYGETGKYYRDILKQKGWSITGDIYDVNCAVTLNTVNVSENIFKIQNPVKDFLNIQGGDKIKTIEIYDMTGRLLKIFKSPNPNVSDLTKGSYLLKMLTETGTVTQKIIKE